MFNRTIYITSFILFLLAFISCQESTTGPETINSGVSILPDNPIPDIDVKGKVFKDSNPVYAATVKLYKGAYYLEQDITDGNGEYLVNVCSHQQGAGWYSVKAKKYYRLEEWCDSESFYWDGISDTTFVIDLYLIRCARSN